MQLTVLARTAPSLVGGLNVQLTVSTRVPSGCSTVFTAEVNARSVIASDQFVLAQSGAPAMVVGGATSL